MVHSTVGWVTDPLCLRHDPGGGHPERIDRLQAILDAVSDLPVTPLASRDAGAEELAAVHTADYLGKLETVRGQRGALDADTHVSPDSYDAAIRAAGCAATAVDAVITGDVRRAFAAVRPPGHHAEPGRAMGFCLLDNIAVAAARARAHHGLDRVAIVDFDVHHGNGTQAAFWQDPQVLFVSSHQYPFYPRTGADDEVGEGRGRGATRNFPLMAWSGDETYDALYGGPVRDALDAFAPQLILVSAGYDIHAADPLGAMRVTTAGVAAIVRHLCAAADELCDGRMVCVLEGGYDLDALGASVAATVRVMTGGA